MPLNKLIQEGDNPDITEERLKATFDTDILAMEYKGGPEQLERSRELNREIGARPHLHDPIPISYMTREEKMENACRKATRLFAEVSDFANPLDPYDLMHLLREIIGIEGYPLAIHMLMFVPTIQNQCDAEQKEWWLMKAVRGEIIGTYAQTEMGHGTNLNKIETMATYDKKTEEFVLHSPTITSNKWWPGGLGRSCNWAVVVANLIIDGKNHGPHNFVVPLRDMETHRHLKGVKLGDIGPKMGVNGIDNGFLSFDHYRIPRRFMLSKHAKVAPDGTYTKPLNSKMGYSTMVHVRSEMVMHLALYFSYAVTIAIRYSAIRRQGEITPGTGEVRILDYQTQQHRVFPQLARVFAFHYSGEEVRAMCRKCIEAMNNGQTAQMLDLHALSSGLKAVVTFQSGQGIEQCRMACGGHGYSDASNLPVVYTCSIGACTYEGENLVMLLQLARYLMKQATLARAGDNVAPLVSYLLKPEQKTSLIDRIPYKDYSNYLLDFEHIARRRIFAAYDRMERLRDEGIPTDQAWNENAVEMSKASTAHARLFIATAFYNNVQKVSDASVKSVLSDLSHLHMTVELLDMSASLLEDGYMSSKQLRVLKEEMYRLLQKIRPNAVSIVDSFDANDRELRSVLGRRDGNVYENLYKWAAEGPSNKDEVAPTFEKYLKPMMKAKL